MRVAAILVLATTLMSIRGHRPDISEIPFIVESANWRRHRENPWCVHSVMEQFQEGCRFYTKGLN